jgi:para-aminobenzoate synthetase component I
MIRHCKEFKITDLNTITNQLLVWAASYREVVFLNSNQHTDPYGSFDFILAVDAFTSLKTDYTNAFFELEAYQQNTKDWLFGHFSYDLKNNIEALESLLPDTLEFPDLFFFQPKKVIYLKNNKLFFDYLNCCADEVDEDYRTICSLNLTFEKDTTKQQPETVIQSKLNRNQYIDKVKALQKHIQLGEIYEINFCTEFFKEKTVINPVALFFELNELSEAPFSTFYKNHNHFAISSSPERYVCKKGSLVISQPIKGTSKRHEDPLQDEQSKKNLATDEKERSENIMITDLVRNDLSKIAQKGSVRVEELCKIYSYKQVHQMVSTISAQIRHEVSPVAVIKNTFPMGSMTGAPKVAAMQFIEKFELFKRGLYSGAIGYFSPNGDFDFNVVIRTLLYNESKKHLSFSVGSAITALSIPEEEYEECLLKAKALHRVCL